VDVVAGFVTGLAAEAAGAAMAGVATMALASKAAVNLIMTPFPMLERGRTLGVLVG
jgi:hypothetical protein